MRFIKTTFALDYLLASEGEVCGKFILSNCCLHIDDTGKVIEEITGKMEKKLLMFQFKLGKGGILIIYLEDGS
jgi:hypothetical protein